MYSRTFLYNTTIHLNLLQDIGLSLCNKITNDWSFHLTVRLSLRLIIAVTIFSCVIFFTSYFVVNYSIEISLTVTKIMFNI